MKPGYKQTEVGVIPEEWEAGSLGRIWSVIDCKHVTAQFVNDGFPLASIREVQSRFVDLTTAKQTTAHFYNQLIEGGRKPRSGDMILSRNATVGEVAQVAEWHPPFAMGQDVCLLRKKEACQSTEFLQAVFQSPIILNQLANLMVGSTFKRANVQQIRDFSVPMPPHREQRAIATALSDVDELLGALDRLIAKKRDLKQAAMQQLLTGQTRLPGFKGEWVDTTVGVNVLKSFCGPSPTCEERNVEGAEEWGVLKTTAITWENGWDWTRHKTLPKRYWNRPNIELRKGDVLVTKAGPRHRVGVSACIDYVPDRIMPSGKMIALRPLPGKAVPLMLASAIASRDAQIYMDQRTTGMAESQVNFENTVLLEAPIKMPTFAEQTAIAEVLSEMDAELSGLEQRREKTRALKQGMMQELLTGRTRLA